MGALNVMGDDTGAVYLYSLGSFISTGSNVSSMPVPFEILYGPSPGVEFGSDVALSRDGTRLVVGSRAEDESTGAVRIYQIVNESATLTDVFAGREPGGQAGWSVAISGDGNVVAVGATKGGSEGGGSVTTYQYQDPDAWIPYGSVVEGKTEGDMAGYSVALTFTGALMAVGSVRATESTQLANAGKAIVYVIDDVVNGTVWTQRDEIFAEVKGVLDGTSVALAGDGSILVVGGRGGVHSRCRIFIRNGDRFEFELLHTMSRRTRRERLGSSAAVSEDGNVIACGGVAAKPGGGDTVTGVVRIFNRTSSLEKEIWPAQDDRTDLPGRDSSFGSSLSLSSDGNIVSVGASTWIGSKDTLPGAVHVFNIN